MKVLTKLSNLTMNDVPLEATFEWNFTRGASPNVYRYKADYSCIEDIVEKAKQKRISIGDSGSMPTVDVKYSGFVNFKKYEYEIKNLLILNKDLNHIINSTLILADIRYFLSFLSIRGYYNMVRKINAYTIAKAINATQDATKAEKLVKKEEFEDRYRLNQYAYQQWSINGNSPWKSIELIEKIMIEYFGNYWGGFVTFKGGKVYKTTPDWSDVAPENKVYNGTNATTVINELLKESRSAAYVFPDGKFYVCDLSDDNIYERLPAGYEQLLFSSQKITQKDNSVIRPVYYEVQFEPEYEFPLIYHFTNGTQIDYKNESTKIISEQSNEYISKGIRKSIRGLSNGLGTTDSVENRVFTGKQKNYFSRTKVNIEGNLINVMKLPFALNYNGERYEAETWIDINYFLDWIGFPYEDILLFWYNAKWSIRFSRTYQRKMREVNPSFPFANSPTKAIREHDNRFKMLVQSISQSFWKTFMIVEELRDKIIRWTPHRAAIAQRRTGHRIHSPVWCNYIDYESIRTFLAKGKAGHWERMAINYNLDYKDMSFYEILQDDPTPFPIRLVDFDAGVF